MIEKECKPGFMPCATSAAPIMSMQLISTYSMRMQAVFESLTRSILTRRRVTDLMRHSAACSC